MFTMTGMDGWTRGWMDDHLLQCCCHLLVIQVHYTQSCDSALFVT